MSRDSSRTFAAIRYSVAAVATKDPVAIAALALTALLALLYAATLPPLALWPGLLESDAPDLLYTCLVLWAFQRGSNRIEAKGERRFYNYLTVAFAAWGLSVLVSWLYPAPGVDLYLIVETLYAVYYAAVLIAVEGRPDRPGDRRPTSSALAWSAIVVLVLGLFVYFVLIPIFLTPRAYEAVSPSAYLYLVLDTYLTARLVYLGFTAKTPRWQAVFMLFGLMAGIILVNDTRYSLFPVLGVSNSWGIPGALMWNLQYVAAVFAARIRHSAFPLWFPEASESVLEAERPEPWREQTLAFVLLFPLVHFAFHSAGLLDEEIRPVREATMFAWLILMGAVAVVQSRRLERSHRELEEETASLATEVAWQRKMEQERERFIAQLEAGKAEAEARKAEMERFADSVSQDLSGPVDLIRGSLRAIGEETARGNFDRVRQEQRTMNRAARQTARLLEELEELTRVSSSS